MIRLKNVAVPLGTDPLCAKEILKKALSCPDVPDFEYTLAHCSLDCRGNRPPRRVCAYNVTSSEERMLYENAVRNGIECEYPYIPKEYVFPASVPSGARPVVVGFGPAGIFCALMLAEHGFAPIIVERGDALEKTSQTRTAATLIEKRYSFGCSPSSGLGLLESPFCPRSDSRRSFS